MVLSFRLAGDLFCQSTISPADFDSIYREALSCLPDDREKADQELDILSAFLEECSPVQKAQVSFLRFIILRSDKKKLAAIETRIYSAPDSLDFIDSLLYSSERYLERSMPDKAIPLLLNVIEMLPENSERSGLCKINLCEAYRQKQEYAKGISILNELLSGKTSLTDDDRAFACNRLAALYNEWNYPKPGCIDSVYKYSNLCMELSMRTDYKPNLAASQNELSFQYLRKKEYDRALELSKQAVKNFSEDGMPFHAMNALINQSKIYIGEKKFGSALKAIEEAINMSDIEQNRNLYMRLFFELARIYQLKGDIKEAFELLKISYTLQSGFFRDRIDMQINEQSAKYDLLVKEQKIREEKEKNEFRRKENTFLIIVSVSLIIAFVAILFYYRLRRKEIIRKKLMEAVAETETQERKRIARDLHDGLGPVLSAINHYFQAFLDSRPEAKETIRRKLQQVIADAIEEVSRISQNISPHVLEHHGLTTALNNFLSPFTRNNNIQVSFQSDLPQRFDHKKELTVYRCITELFTNTLKHACATEVSLNITGRNNTLHVLYSDNGIGFNSGLQRSGGMGLDNIRHRIESFGGTLSIESDHNKGMKARIEIPI